MKKLCILLIVILSVLCVFASCKKKETDNDSSGVNSTGNKIEYTEEVESLTSEEYEDLVSWWGEVTSNNSSIITIAPVTSTDEETSSKPESTSSQEVASNSSSDSAESSSSEVSSTTSDKTDTDDNTSIPDFIPGYY